ncbi:C13 family peptidase [Dasania marina]|uniref:C13 family peptidase n=1 Tax=Dasania marina TaxID=471499 RepID=UPI0030DDD7F5|tara:strand:- start:8474 stop:9385 length:912 start_codon:yes stop_codon:yes gene_type:complete
MKIIIGSLLLLLAQLSLAGIYKWVDEQGRVYFSDKKPELLAYEDIESRLFGKGNVFNNSVKGSQTELIASFADNIAAGVPGQTDLFFVSFAGDAKQDVFMKETLYAQQLFDSHYHTAGRSVALINNSKTTSRYLVASDNNLARVLKTVGEKMNEEDVLYLYLSSHGSRQHLLSVDFPPHTVKDFGGQEIRKMLDEAGIKWRIVVVSACYAGGFIAPLKTDYSVIATAADAYNTSFGCADNRDFTFYGEAIFKRQMATGVGLLEALDGAREIVKSMEAQRNLTPSNPQYWLGSKAKTKLQRELP